MGRIQLNTLAVTTITAIAIVLSQLLSFQALSSDSASINQEQHDNSPDEDVPSEVYISTASISLPSSIHLEVNHDTFCLFEIMFEWKKSVISNSDIGLLYSEFFRTLFSTIISPNAP